MEKMVITPAGEGGLGIRKEKGEGKVPLKERPASSRKTPIRGEGKLSLSTQQKGKKSTQLEKKEKRSAVEQRFRWHRCYTKKRRGERGALSHRETQTREGACGSDKGKAARQVGKKRGSIAGVV